MVINGNVRDSPKSPYGYMKGGGYHWKGQEVGHLSCSNRGHGELSVTDVLVVGWTMDPSSVTIEARRLQTRMG